MIACNSALARKLAMPVGPVGAGRPVLIGLAVALALAVFGRRPLRWRWRKLEHLGRDQGDVQVVLIQVVLSLMTYSATFPK